MKLLVTAGPTREPIDAVRFITNASSGQMGYAVAAAGVAAGMQVTLLSGPVGLKPPAGCRVVPFVTVTDLRRALKARFDTCDALVMSAAVGDFTLARPAINKLHRFEGPLTLTLLPTEDLLAAMAMHKKVGQQIVAFAVEDGPPERPGGRGGEAGVQGRRPHRGQHPRGHLGPDERRRRPVLLGPGAPVDSPQQGEVGPRAGSPACAPSPQGGASGSEGSGPLRQERREIACRASPGRSDKCISLQAS